MRLFATLVGRRGALQNKCMEQGHIAYASTMDEFAQQNILLTLPRNQNTLYMGFSHVTHLRCDAPPNHGNHLVQTMEHCSKLALVVIAGQLRHSSSVNNDITQKLKDSLSGVLLVRESNGHCFRKISAARHKHTIKNKSNTFRES
jgi:hypothetical protein